MRNALHSSGTHSDNSKNHVLLSKAAKFKSNLQNTDGDYFNNCSIQFNYNPYQTTDNDNSSDHNSDNDSSNSYSSSLSSQSQRSE